MKKIMMTLLLTACSDEIIVNTNEDRLAELERRADINDALNTLQNVRLDSLELKLIQIEDRVESLETSTSSAILQGQVDALSLQINTINSSLYNMQTQLTNHAVDLQDIEDELALIRADVDNVSLNVLGLQSDFSSLEADVLALEARLDAEGVTVYKCNSLTSTEKILKVSGVFYGVINRVTVGSASVVTTGSPQSITIPKLCSNSGGSVKAPDGSGNCTGSGWGIMSGTGVTVLVPSNSSTTIPVVTSVQIALEALTPGQNYTTTDGSPICTFNGDGTNLVRSP